MDATTPLPPASPAPAPVTPTTPPPSPTPQGTPPPIPVTEVPEAPQAPKAKSSAGKVIAGAIGVLFLAGAAGAGVILTQKSQETRSPASTGSLLETPLPTTVVESSGAKTTSSEHPNVSNSLVSGNICTDKLAGPGTVLLFNTTLRLVGEVPVAAGQTTFQSSFPVGTVFVVFTDDATGKYLGYTDANHNLARITLTESQPAVNIGVCDPGVKNPIPSGDFKSLQ